MTVGLVLAPGKGTRLRPFTDERPKVLVPVHGRTILEHQLAMFRAMGVERAVVLMRPSHVAGRPLVERAAARAGFPADIVTFAPDAFAGQVEPTSFPFRPGLDALGELTSTETCVVVNCDLLLGPGWDDVVRDHHRLGADLTLATTTLDDADSGNEPIVRWVRHGPDGRLVSHTERPDGGAPAREIGLSVIEPRAWALLDELPLRAPDPWTEELVPLMLARGMAVRTWASPAPWRDAGTWPRILRAHAEAGSDTHVDDDATVEDGAVLDACVVMDGAYVGAGAALRRTVVLPGATVPPGTRLEETVVGRDGFRAPLAG